MSLENINKSLEQIAGPYFTAMGLETPQLRPLSTGKSETPDSAVGIKPFKREETPTNSSPSPQESSLTADKDSAKPAAKDPAKGTAPAQGKGFEKPHRTASAQISKSARAHSFTPSNQHAPNALQNLQKNKGSAPQKGAAQWLEKAKGQPQGITNGGVKNEVQAVQDYLARARRNDSAADSQSALKNAGDAMHRLDILSRDPKSRDPKNFNYISQHDRQTIAATRQIYENHRKLKWGQAKEDPDLHLLRMSYERKKKEGSVALTRLPENSQLAKKTEPALPATSPKPQRLQVAQKGHGPSVPRRLQTVMLKPAPRPLFPRPLPDVAKNLGKPKPGFPRKIG